MLANDNTDSAVDHNSETYIINYIYNIPVDRVNLYHKHTYYTSIGSI